jgi:hypothetical protein
MKQGIVHFAGAVFLVLLGLSASLQPVLACVAEAVRPELQEDDAPQDSEQRDSEERDGEQNTASIPSDASQMIHGPGRVFRATPFVVWLAVRASEQTTLPRISTRPLARLACAPVSASVWGRAAHWPCGPPISIVL